MADIKITSPTFGATVNRPFTASGTYNSGDPFPQVTVVLKDSNGNVVATGFPVTVGNGTWSATLSPTQGYTGATVEATLVGTGLTDSAGNITVNP